MLFRSFKDVLGKRRVHSEELEQTHLFVMSKYPLFYNTSAPWCYAQKLQCVLTVYLLFWSSSFIESLKF